MRKILILAAAFFTMSASTAAFADVDITQADMAFSQEKVTLKAGDSIHFANKDTVDHDVEVIDSDGNVDDKGLQKPGGDIVDAKFAQPGEYTVRCAIHPKMKLNVTVQ